MRSLTVVALATLCLMGASALALADEALKSEMGQKGRMKAERDAMKGEMRTDPQKVFLSGGGNSSPNAYLCIEPSLVLFPHRPFARMRRPNDRMGFA